MIKLIQVVFTAFTLFAGIYYSVEFINTHAALSAICALLYISATIFNVATCIRMFKDWY